MTPVMYEVPSDQTIAKVTITPEAIRNEAEPLIERQADRPERPRLGAAALRAEKGGKPPAKGNAS
jgi:ATP-dependent Clp protease ATP-binding subunit ClpX